MAETLVRACIISIRACNDRRKSMRVWAWHSCTSSGSTGELKKSSSKVLVVSFSFVFSCAAWKLVVCGFCAVGLDGGVGTKNGKFWLELMLHWLRQGQCCIIVQLSRSMRARLIIVNLSGLGGKSGTKKSETWKVLLVHNQETRLSCAYRRRQTVNPIY